MINRNQYLNQVEELTNSKNLDQKDFITLLEALDGNSNINTAFMADQIIEMIFGGIYQEILVPWKFFDTEIGKALLQAKFNIASDDYLIEDLKEITGYSKQYISREINNKNLKAEKKGGTWYIKRNDANEYLIKKGFNIDKNNNK